MRRSMARVYKIVLEKFNMKVYNNDISFAFSQSPLDHRWANKRIDNALDAKRQSNCVRVTYPLEVDG
jgi:hypothetical protein